MADAFVIYVRPIDEHDIERPIGVVEGKHVAEATVYALKQRMPDSDFRCGEAEPSAPMRQVLTEEIIAAGRGECGEFYQEAAEWVHHLRHSLTADQPQIEEHPPGSGKRPAYERDHLWLKWNAEEGLKPAAIRDRWNKMSDDERKDISAKSWRKVSRGNSGRAVIYDALKRATRDK